MNRLVKKKNGRIKNYFVLVVVKPQAGPNGGPKVAYVPKRPSCGTDRLTFEQTF